MNIKAADLFCGAGGTSTGLRMACEELGRGLDLLAVNHWNLAIETHTLNHPNTQHLCESLDNVNPRHVVPGQRLNLLVASPECTHFSNSRGGKPMKDQSRASAWHVLRWAEAITVDNILLENVREFRNWGPLNLDGRPKQKRKGETYIAFLNALRSLGYSVEDKILNAADYGDPTSRERLFIMARRGNRKIQWPTPSHAGKAAEGTLFDHETKPWRAAREIIDWNLKGQSIFDRKRPLAPKTLDRIMAGLRKFGGANAESFIVVLRNHMGAQSMDAPIPTVTAGGNHIGVCQSFLVGAGGPTGKSRPASVEHPLGTVLAENHTALVQPFIVPQFGGNPPRSIDKPLNTVTTTSRGIGLLETFLVSVNHGDEGSAAAAARCHDVDKPLPTVTTKNGYAMVDPYLVKFYGNGDSISPVGDPVPTVTTKDRFGLVEVDGQMHKLDIRFRMLQPHELAAAQGFPKEYQFAGNRESVVKQIGNAVPVNLAKSLCMALLQ